MNGFLLTRPVRGATVAIFDGAPALGISTHTPRAGRDQVVALACKYGAISTHTPRAGRDICEVEEFEQILISTHTPRAGRDCYIHSCS